MFPQKKAKFTSYQRYSKLIFVLSSIITFGLINGCPHTASERTETLPDQDNPPPHCLLSHIHLDHFSFYDASDQMLWLRLPSPKRFENCSVEPKLLKYTIMYAEVKEECTKLCSPQTCNIVETSESIVEINNLRPHTKYQFQIRASDDYTEQLDMKPKFTKIKIFQTQIGAPSRPRNVEAKILSPTEIVLKWLPPIESNGPSIRYEINYEIENVFIGYKNTFRFLIRDANITSANITNLTPNQVYTVWVRAYTTKILYNQSRPLKFKTPSESRIDSHIQNSVGEPNVPQNLMVILVAALALFIMMNIGWIILGFIYAALRSKPSNNRNCQDEDNGSSNSTSDHEYEEIDETDPDQYYAIVEIE